jgi:alkaline phosphatase
MPCLQPAGVLLLLGLFANEEMFQQAPEGQGAVYDPPVSLPEMTQKAIDILSQDPEGFFLMVEEEGIDEMAHQIQSDPEYPNESGEGAPQKTDRSG